MQYSQESFCVGVSFGISPLGLQLYQRENLIQVFSCEYSEIFKNTSFEKQLPTAASNNQVRINIGKENGMGQNVNSLLLIFPMLTKKICFYYFSLYFQIYAELSSKRFCLI